MIRVRLKFSKHGPIRFVGHLDLMRYFQKVMRRAGVDIAYSEGYSPHQLMSFALPLPTGATSDGEYVDLTLQSFRDIRLHADEESDGCIGETRDALLRVTGRMNDVMREGIRVTDACILPEGAAKAMTAVSACRWRITFHEEDAAGARALELIRAAGGTDGALSRFLSRKEIRVLKKTKKSERELDLRPLIYEACAPDDGAVSVLLKAGSEDNVKPVLFVAAWLASLTDGGESVQDLEQSLSSTLQLHREETCLTKRLPEGDVLLPLISQDGINGFPLKNAV
ncbi:MAG: DUF2344 domain-containing protein [Lachnospiraceae bacterium]|nr:DUF2344 domain-containing protein [Lachnospiraceae bacterium]